MKHSSHNGRFFLTQSIRLWVLLVGVSVAVSISGCGRKAPLYIPTDAQKTQMKKEKAERDAILKAREERAQKAAETDTPTEDTSNK
ncbi:LPS translocon maturation chaperone LptM [Hydrogenovibrio kuenenii]|uniref:LPS translocon maturation chaperone LptM n=1 Tax=Hydrogenovibrio kuenenii TaxID=63658 RepID=UPI000464A38D|nr:lipoprotein [Hydrogenovibrio kuenenii]